MIEIVAEHSVETSLLNGGVCIDIGCLGFVFSNEMKRRGLDVYAFDIQEMEPPDGIHFRRAAVLDRDGQAFYTPMSDLQAFHVSASGVPIEAISLDTIYALVGENVDIMKCDAEGSEYLLFSNPAFKPIPRQISIEFHRHCHRELHDRYFDLCTSRLLDDYDAVHHQMSEAHGAGLNWWDSLFVRKY